MLHCKQGQKNPAPETSPISKLVLIKGPAEYLISNNSNVCFPSSCRSAHVVDISNVPIIRFTFFTSQEINIIFDILIVSFYAYNGRLIEQIEVAFT